MYMFTQKFLLSCLIDREILFSSVIPVGFEWSVPVRLRDSSLRQDFVTPHSPATGFKCPPSFCMPSGALPCSSSGAFNVIGSSCCHLPCCWFSWATPAALWFTSQTCVNRHQKSGPSNQGRSTTAMVCPVAMKISFLTTQSNMSTITGRQRIKKWQEKEWELNSNAQDDSLKNEDKHSSSKSVRLFFVQFIHLFIQKKQAEWALKYTLFEVLFYTQKSH